MASEALAPIPYPDELLLEILATSRTIAMVGASPSWNRPSFFAMRYLQRKGYRVIPVNPRAVDAPILGESVYPDLASVPGPVDIVDVFRRAEDTPGIAREAVAIGARVPGSSSASATPRRRPSRRLLDSRWSRTGARRSNTGVSRASSRGPASTPAS